MREILFRGRRCDNSEWVEGDLRHYPSGSLAIRSEQIGHTVTVRPETVGQYTGMTDKNSERIFEGDLVEGLFYQSFPVAGTVRFADGSFGIAWMRGDAEMFTPFTSTCNVVWRAVGNAHAK